MTAFARILALAFSLVAGAAGAQPVRGDHIESELIAATDAAVPGRPLQVALRLKHDPHWHTYWQVPGDSGLPTKIAWKLPAGWQAGPIEWPVPQRLPVGPLMNFGYEGEVLLLATLTPPPGLAAGGSVEFAARADWLICKDICIPGGADLKLALPVREAAGPSRHAAKFAAARNLVPQPVALESATATIDDKRVRLAFKPPATNAWPSSVEFFPLQQGRIEAAAKQILRREGDLAALYLTAARPATPDFATLEGVLVVDGGPARADRGGWAGVVSVPLAAGRVPAVEAEAAIDSVGAPMTLWVALAGAFVGGLILNLMPCVFPVLSLKLLSLVQVQRAEDDAHVAHPPLRAHGLVYAAGVIASFVLLAVGLIALRAAGEQLGWGFQLQTPWVVAVLTGLFFVIGLNLIGAFEFTWGSALANMGAGQQPARDRLSGSFGTGVLAVVVAAPCTAPFMGAALGFAVTQPASVALSVFAMLGAGMAAPYVALTWFPRLLARLPRPGVWMERFRQIMAFPMFATCAWLLWVLAQQVDVDAVGLMLLALVLLGLATWAVGLAQRGAAHYRWVAVGAALLAAYATFSATGTGSVAARPQAAAQDDAAAWQPWSRAAMEQALAEGKPVFVDFTAAWCVTCQANKRLVLTAATVEKAFSERGVVRMRADWTNRDAEITRELARFNRNGVPLYVLYDGKGRTQVLPELLTERIVLDALARL